MKYTQRAKPKPEVCNSIDTELCNLRKGGSTHAVAQHWLLWSIANWVREDHENTQSWYSVAQHWLLWCMRRLAS